MSGQPGGENPAQHSPRCSGSVWVPAAVADHSLPALQVLLAWGWGVVAGAAPADVQGVSACCPSMCGPVGHAARGDAF